MALLTNDNFIMRYPNNTEYQFIIAIDDIACYIDEKFVDLKPNTLLITMCDITIKPKQIANILIGYFNARDD